MATKGIKEGRAAVIKNRGKLSPASAIESPTRIGGWKNVRQVGRQASTGLILSYQNMLSNPMQVVETVRKGVPASNLLELADVVGVSREKMLNMLGIPRATILKKAKNAELMGREASQRFVDMTKLITQVEAMLDDAGDPDVKDFNPTSWLAEWLQTPSLALDGEPPANMLDTAEGFGIVSQLLKQIHTGAYA